MSAVPPKLKKLYDGVNDLEINDTDAETRSRYAAFRRMEDPLRKIRWLLADMSADIGDKGRLVKNANGRYEIEGTDTEFTSGSSVHVWDDEDECWIYTSIEHSGDYYIVALGKNVPIEGKLVRRPIYR